MRKIIPFGERVASFRRSLGLNQKEFAPKLGVSSNYLSMIEQGREPSDNLVRLFDMIEKDHARSKETGSTLRDLIKQARADKGFSISDLAKKTKYSVGVLQAIEEGSARISEKMAKAIAAALDLDVEALLDGSDHPKIISENGMHGTIGATPNIIVGEGVGKPRYIPLISFAQAGTMKSFDDLYEYEGWAAFDPKDPKAFAVRITGDSMSPAFGEADVVTLYPTFQPRNGDLVIARLSEDHGGDVMFKLFNAKGAGQQVILTSYNVAYPPLEFDRSSFMWIYPVAAVTKVFRR